MRQTWLLNYKLLRLVEKRCEWMERRTKPRRDGGETAIEIWVMKHEGGRAVCVCVCVCVCGVCVCV